MFKLHSVHVACGGGLSFGGIVICYVLPVFWMTSCFIIIGPIPHQHSCSVMFALTPLCVVLVVPCLDDGGRQDQTSPSSKGCW